MHALTSLVLGLALAAQPSADAAEPSPPDRQAQADDAVARARGHFEAKQWDAAVEALMEAYALVPDPAYLYARAQAERMRGNCKVALALYQRFLDSDPTQWQREDTARHIRLCEEMLFNEDAASKSQADPPPAGAASSSPPPTRDEPSTPRPWSRDPLGLTLVVSGSALLVAGIVVVGIGGNDVRRAPEGSEAEYEQRAAQGRTRLVVGSSVLSAGAVLGVGGAIRLGMLARNRRVAVSPWGTPEGFGLTAILRM